MRLRTVSLAFLLAMVCTGLSWLTWQPLALRLVDALQRLSTAGSPERALVSGLKRALPVLLAADVGLSFAVAYLVLHLTVLRPLRGAERAIEQLGQLRLEADLPFERAPGSPLLARVQSALGRLAEALRKEQSTTRRQLAELTAANQRLAHAQTELLASERLATVGRLAAGVAHEVGNPLSGILGYLSLAEGRAQDRSSGSSSPASRSRCSGLTRLSAGSSIWGARRRAPPPRWSSPPWWRAACASWGRARSSPRWRWRSRWSRG